MSEYAKNIYRYFTETEQERDKRLEEERKEYRKRKDIDLEYLENQVYGKSNYQKPIEKEYTPWYKNSIYTIFSMIQNDEEKEKKEYRKRKDRELDYFMNKMKEQERSKERIKSEKTKRQQETKRQSPILIRSSNLLHSFNILEINSDEFDNLSQGNKIETLRKQYKILSLKYHPDKLGKQTEKFRHLTQARTCIAFHYKLPYFKYENDEEKDCKFI